MFFNRFLPSFFCNTERWHKGGLWTHFLGLDFILFFYLQWTGFFLKVYGKESWSPLWRGGRRVRWMLFIISFPFGGYWWKDFCVCWSRHSFSVELLIVSRRHNLLWNILAEALESDLFTKPLSPLCCCPTFLSKPRGDWMFALPDICSGMRFCTLASSGRSINLMPLSSVS